MDIKENIIKTTENLDFIRNFDCTDMTDLTLETLVKIGKMAEEVIKLKAL